MAQGTPPAPVLVKPVEAEILRSQRRVTGELHAAARSRVATAEEGRVLECPAEEGLVVQAGGRTLDGSELGWEHRS